VGRTLLSDAFDFDFPAGFDSSVDMIFPCGSGLNACRSRERQPHRGRAALQRRVSDKMTWGFSP
jgi:hypothetical protein